MMGVGVAEKAGMMGALIRKLVAIAWPMDAPKRLTKRSATLSRWV
jgi:p-aminobenzoyl-glutamate transporter AbgT